MNNLIKELELINNKEYELTKKDTIIQQTQRNGLRQELIKTLMLDFEIVGITSHQVQEGIIIEIPNKELGVIYALLKPTIKGLDYDLDNEKQDYINKQEKKKEKGDKKNANANKRAK